MWQAKSLNLWKYSRHQNNCFCCPVIRPGTLEKQNLKRKRNLVMEEQNDSIMREIDGEKEGNRQTAMRYTKG